MMMSALKGLVGVCAFAVMILPAFANNVSRQGAVNVPQGLALPPDQHLGTRVRSDSGACAKPRMTPEQRAQRRALREQRLAQGIHHVQRTPEQKARAAARRAARCANGQGL
jgi:hypothetical protein